jgi:hypothetical protein
MSIKLDDHAPERGTFHLDCDFEDELQAGIVPSSIAWTLTDRDGGVVNGRSAVAVAVPATAVTITLVGTDLTLVTGQTNERLFLLEWVYDSSYGSGLLGKEQATFIIDPLKAVP